MNLRLWVAAQICGGQWEFAKETAPLVVEGATKMADALIEACGQDPNEELNLAWRKVVVGEAVQAFERGAGGAFGAVDKCWAYNQDGKMCTLPAVGIDMDAGIPVCAQHRPGRARVLDETGKMDVGVDAGQGAEPA